MIMIFSVVSPEKKNRKISNVFHQLAKKITKISQRNDPRNHLFYLFCWPFSLSRIWGCPFFEIHSSFEVELWHAHWDAHAMPGDLLAWLMSAEDAKRSSATSPSGAPFTVDGFSWENVQETMGKPHQKIGGSYKLSQNQSSDPIGMGKKYEKMLVKASYSAARWVKSMLLGSKKLGCFPQKMGWCTTQNIQRCKEDQMN